MLSYNCFNPLQNDEILDWSKLKALADNSLNVIPMMINVPICVESILGNGENAVHQHFLLFPECFQEHSC